VRRSPLELFILILILIRGGRTVAVAIEAVAAPPLATMGMTTITKPGTRHAVFIGKLLDLRMCRIRHIRDVIDVAQERDVDAFWGWA